MPRPFAERVKESWYCLVDGIGVVYFYQDGTKRRYSTSRGVEIFPPTKWHFAPFGFADGYYYGTGEPWAILKTRDLAVEPVVAEQLLFSRKFTPTPRFNADEGGIYSGRQPVRNGRLSAPMSLPPWPYAYFDRNYLMNRSSIFWTDFYDRRYGDPPGCYICRGREETFEKTTYLKAINKDGTYARILATGRTMAGRGRGEVMLGVAVDDQWVYYIQHHDGSPDVTLNCVPSNGGPSRTFMTAREEDSLTLLGVSDSYLYLGLLGSDLGTGPNWERLRGRDLYRIALPVCQ